MDEALKKGINIDLKNNKTLNNIDVLIDGPFILKVFTFLRLGKK